MSRLYPPVISGTLPAFYGATLVVPFSVNRAVSAAEVSNIMVKVKTVSGEIKETKSAERYEIGESIYATFGLNSALYTIGQYYKVQIAFVNKNDEVGYYSTVGVVKYTTQPNVYIEGLSFGIANTHIYSYTGIYSQFEGDTTEKMHSGRFKVFNGKGELVEDTGWILHSVIDDASSFEAAMLYTFPQDIELNESYTIQFMVQTKNGMEVQSPRYRINQKRSVKPDVDAELVATLDRDNGVVVLSFENSSKPTISGSFLISRRGSDEPGIWQELRRITLHSIQIVDWSYTDCTVAHGITYEYSIQQYNQNGIYSDRIQTKPTLVQYEDSFLYDGEKQLRIRFNPKVSSFKINLAEQKTESIGRQHPFIIRNGNMNYREFPISGLISYKMDEDKQMFADWKELGITSASTDLTPENVAAERIFKMKVLDWLTNGKVKLFRSPAEGSFIVRLMNVSLSPNDTLSRMLHTFSATAYELATFNNKNLESYGIINSSSDAESQMQWASVDLRTLYPLTLDKTTGLPKDPHYIEINNHKACYSVQFIDMEPGSVIYLNNEKIIIGITGAYSLKVDKPLNSVRVKSTNILKGVFTYSYQSTSANKFGIINDLKLIENPCHQFIGNSKIVKYQKNILDDEGRFEVVEMPATLYECVQNVFQELTGVSTLRFFKRPLLTLFIPLEPTYDENGEVLYGRGIEEIFSKQQYYLDMDCSEDAKVDMNKLDPWALYQIRFKRSDYRNYKYEQYFVDKNVDFFSEYTNRYLDGYTKQVYTIDNSEFQIMIDDEIIDIDKLEKYTVAIPNDAKVVKPGNGVVSEIGYSLQQIAYSFELDDINVKNAKLNYFTLLDRYKDAKNKPGVTAIELNEKLSLVETAKRDYIIALEEAIENYKEAYGIE